MKESEGFLVAVATNDATVNKVFYTIMNEITDKYDTDRTSLAQLNTMTRKVARDYFFLNYPHGKVAAQQASTMPHHPLSPMDMLIPVSEDRAQQQQQQQPSDVLASRYIDVMPPQHTPGAPPITPHKEQAADPEEVDELLLQFKQEREQQVVLSPAVASDAELQVSHYSSPEPSINKDSSPEKLGTRVTYVCVNGFDRDVRSYPLRSSFRVTLTSPIKNVQSIKVGFVQIPCEFSNIPHQVYNSPLEMTYPYLLLRIDELKSDYEGSNPVVTRALCTLTFVRNNYPVNSRGFVTLVPGQHEVCRFDQAPLSSLSTITLSLLCPNGEAFPVLRDDHRVMNLELRASTDPVVSEFGGALRVSIHKMVDTNEYAVLDRVIISGFAWSAYQVTIPGTDQAPPRITYEYPEPLRKFVDFMNQPQGHTVIGLDRGTVAARFQAFMIRLPGAINDDTGVWTPDPELLSALEELGMADLEVDRNCRVMNASLQMSVGLQATTLVPDLRTPMWESKTMV